MFICFTDFYQRFNGLTQHCQTREYQVKCLTIKQKIHSPRRENYHSFSSALSSANSTLVLLDSPSHVYPTFSTCNAVLVTPFHPPALFPAHHSFALSPRSPSHNFSSDCSRYSSAQRPGSKNERN